MKVAGEYMGNKGKCFWRLWKRGKTGDWSPNKQRARSKNGKALGSFKAMGTNPHELPML